MQFMLTALSLKPREKVYELQQILIDATLEEEVHAAAQAIDLDIVYEDDDIIVINQTSWIGGSPRCWQCRWHFDECTIAPLS